MAEADNRRLVEEAFEAINSHDPDRYVKLVDASYVMENPASLTPILGRERVKQFMAMYFKAFPDFHCDVEQIITSGDWVVSRWRVIGTHKGEFNGIPATNRQVTFRGCTVSEIRNGRIAKTSVHYDQLGVLQQLGLSIGKGAGAGG